MQLGTWGEWIGGIGALVPAVLWFFERADRIKAQDEAKAVREEERLRLRESQIRLVRFENTTFKEPKLPDEFMRFEVINDSDAPLGSVSFAFVGYDDRFPEGILTQMGTGSLGPHERRTIPFWRKYFTGKESPFLFVLDVNHVHWKLFDEGTFEELPGPRRPEPEKGKRRWLPWRREQKRST